MCFENDEEDDEDRNEELKVVNFDNDVNDLYNPDLLE